MRITIEKTGRRSWMMRMVGDEREAVVARYRHLGPGPEGAPEVELDADSPQCLAMRAQLKMLQPQMCAYPEGDAKAACLANLEETRKGIEATCPTE